MRTTLVREFKPFGGEDCSYIFPYCGGSSVYSVVHISLTLFTIVVFSVLIYLNI